MFDKDRRGLFGPREGLRVVVAVADPFIDGLFEFPELVKVPRLMCSLVISAKSRSTRSSQEREADVHGLGHAAYTRACRGGRAFIERLNARPLFSRRRWHA